jgi:hypothetical protein
MICNIINYDEYFDDLFTRWYVSNDGNGNYLFTKKSNNGIKSIEIGHVMEKFQYEITFKQMDGKKGKIYLLNDFYYHTIDEVIEELNIIGIK